MRALWDSFRRGFAAGQRSLPPVRRVGWRRRLWCYYTGQPMTDYLYAPRDQFTATECLVLLACVPDDLGPIAVERLRAPALETLPNGVVVLR